MIRHIRLTNVSSCGVQVTIRKQTIDQNKAILVEGHVEKESASRRARVVVVNDDCLFPHTDRVSA